MNYFAIGFVAVAAVIGAGVDYQQQSVKADIPLGRMSLSQYIDTYEARFLGAKAEMAAQEREEQRQEAWRIGGMQYLPEAPEGWTRRAYSEGYNSPIMFDTTVFYEEMAKNGGAQSMAEGIKAKKAKERLGELDKTSWVYEKGNEAIFISVKSKDGVNANGFGALMGMMIGGFDGISARSVLGYDVIGGVGFVELPVTSAMAGMMMSSLDERQKGFKRAHFRRLRGTLGFNQEVEIVIHANASRASTTEVLSAIDWDAMNAMLETPMALVGNDVVLPEEVDKAQMARQMYALHEKFKDLRGRAAQFKLYNANEAALVMNMYSGGTYDMTGGAVPDLSMMIEAAYRKELRDLLAGRPSTNEYQRIVGMMEERPEEERDQPEGEMSEELRNELMGYSDTETQAPGDTNAPGTWPDVVPTGGKPDLNKPFDRAMAEINIRAQAKAMGMSGQQLEFAVQSTLRQAEMQHANNQLLAKRRAEKAAAKVGAPSGAPAASGAGGAAAGLGGWLKGLVGGGEETAQAAPVATGEKAKIRRLGGEGKAIAGGCGAGQFCKTTE
ncbi:hypothetical protein [Rhodalgimonas zhirmunskyi]|uniref:Uncharacterized protein n=1 Tax=Rhodalgimonas zhirmunskyi TaxID=2964767 RepID=A0AAJ1U970_9RHOB|nr:hypothetical protein [Rhodoalgimonas zhirmunskyi]MDQ2093573.1 hypothetical protein [Rhodoalgimonas zhirmunskyi]